MSRHIESVEGRAALVTGAARGIGRAIAEELGRRGCNVYMLDVSKNLLDRSVAELTAEGITASAILCDLADLDQVMAAVDAVRGLGGIDILVNNAAVITPIVPFDELSPETIALTVAVNFTAPLELIRLLQSDLKKRPAACIVNIASQSRIFPLAFLGTYASTKAGLAFFTESIRQELRGSSVHVLRVEPGAVRSEGFQENDQSLLPRGGRIAETIEPSTLARAIVTAIVQGKRELYYPPVPKAFAMLKMLAPGLMRWITTKDQLARARKRRAQPVR